MRRNIITLFALGIPLLLIIFWPEISGHKGDKDKKIDDLETRIMVLEWQIERVMLNLPDEFDSSDIEYGISSLEYDISNVQSELDSTKGSISSFISCIKRWTDYSDPVMGDNWGHCWSMNSI